GRCAVHVCFFFQAEDGIRDGHVTGVQTCALPIFAMGTDTFPPDMIRVLDYGSNVAKLMAGDQAAGQAADLYRAATLGGARALGRSEERRVGKDGSWRAWSWTHTKKSHN